MRIFSLQFGLIVAGIVLVVGVLLYNHWVLRRARAMRDCARLVESPSESTRVEPSLHVMQAGPASDEPRDQPVAASAPEAMVVAESISGGGGTPDNAFPADDAARWQIPMDDVASLPSVPTPTRGRDDVQRGTYRDPTHTQPDPDIECVVVLRPAAPVGVHALAAGLHARLGKPLRWFGHRDASTAWQRLGVDSAGEFAEIAGCLLLADRNGAAGRNQIDAFLRLVGDLAPTLPATFTTRSVDDETARAEALDRLCAELDMQIGITIQKTDGSAIAGTVMAATKLPLRKWFLAMYLMTQSKNAISALEMKRQLGVTYKTAWAMKHKLLEVMVQREAQRQLAGRIEIDDAYLGGERTGGKPGRGSENKIPFVAAIETNPQGQPIFIRLDLVKSFKQRDIQAWAKTALAAQANAVSDGLWGFQGVTAQEGVLHQVYVTGHGKQAAQHPQFHWVNTLLGNLKTALAGTYHAFGFAKYAKRYLAEFQYRFNRRFDLASMLPRLLRAAATTAPQPLRKLRLSEVGS